MFLLAWLALALSQLLGGASWLTWPEDHWLVTAPLALVIAASASHSPLHRRLRVSVAAAALIAYAIVDAQAATILLVAAGVVALLLDARAVPRGGLGRAAFLTQGMLLLAGAGGAWTQPGLDQMVGVGVPLAAGGLLVASVTSAHGRVPDLTLAWMSIGVGVVLVGIFDSWMSGPLEPMARSTVLALLVAFPIFVASLADAWSRREPRAL